METLVVTTFLIIICFSLINLIANGIIYYSSQKQIYLKIGLFWLFLIVNFIVQSNAQQTVSHIIWGFGFSMIPVNLLASASLWFSKNKYPTKAFMAIAILASLITAFIIDLDISFTLKAMPFTLAVSTPLFYVTYVFFVRKWKSTTGLMKFHAFVLMLSGLHAFNFAVFRLDENAQLWGWPVAYALYQLKAALMPALTLDFYHREEQERLTSIIEQRTHDLKQTNRELEKTANDKLYLLRTLTHDISNPINAQSLLVDKLRRSPHDFERLAKKLDVLTRRMTLLVNQVKQFDTFQNGPAALDIRPTNLLWCVEEIETLFEGILEQKRIKLSYDANNLQEIDVNVDSDSFVTSVLANIVSNAIKFSDEDQVIEITAHLDSDSKRPRISITDFGIGMGRVVIEKIFDFSNEGSRLGTSGEAGTGFGVPIAKCLVEAFEGTFEIDSQERTPTQKGRTCITLEIPGQKSSKQSELKRVG